MYHIVVALHHILIHFRTMEKRTQGVDLIDKTGHGACATTEISSS
jgi:hypothetical protein